MNQDAIKRMLQGKSSTKTALEDRIENAALRQKAAVPPYAGPQKLPAVRNAVPQYERPQKLPAVRSGVPEHERPQKLPAVKNAVPEYARPQESAALARARAEKQEVRRNTLAWFGNMLERLQQPTPYVDKGDGRPSPRAGKARDWRARPLQGTPKSGSDWLWATALGPMSTGTAPEKRSLPTLAGDTTSCCRRSKVRPAAWSGPR